MRQGRPVTNTTAHICSNRLCTFHDIGGYRRDVLPVARSVWLRFSCRALAMVLAVAPMGLAGPVASGGRDEDLFIRPEDQRTVLFGSMDGGRSVFVSVGAKQSLTGPLDRTGFVAMETTGFGLTSERFRSGVGDAAPVLRFTHQTSVLIGHQWALNGIYLAAYAGPEAHQEQLAVGGRVYRFSTPRPGARAQLELWAHPTPNTLVTGTLVTGTARTSLWARASAGLRVIGPAFVGPEVTVYATPTYRETRFGGHVTGFGFGILRMRASAGWMIDDAHRRGSPYAGLTAWVRL